jgi:hypothetical protein
MTIQTYVEPGMSDAVAVAPAERRPAQAAVDSEPGFAVKRGSLIRDHLEPWPPIAPSERESTGLLLRARHAMNCEADTS